ncbi:hypothetical protein ACJEDT_13030 [Rhodococcoides fascians]|uniref:hypothetical protein n=1 Tax=Rhodococcoides fascians TaxID=1828 RepID=UPI003899B89A
MGSLSDPSNFGAEPVDPLAYRYYGGERIGPGRWALIPGLGMLWTDDASALQLSRIDGADLVAANALRKLLHTLARDGITATAAFDSIVADRDATVTSGDLSSLQ